MANSAVSQRVSLMTFTLGFFSALRCRGVLSIRYNQTHFNKTLTDFFPRLQELAIYHGIDLRFRMTPGPHGISVVSESVVPDAMQLGIVSLDAPGFDVLRIQQDEELSWSRVNELPGGSEFYKEVAKLFIDLIET